MKHCHCKGKKKCDRPKEKTLPYGNMKKETRKPLMDWVHKFKYKKGTMMV